MFDADAIFTSFKSLLHKHTMFFAKNIHECNGINKKNREKHDNYLEYAV